MKMKVFVLDKHHKPLMPCTPKRARLMLDRGRARIHKLHPFTIRLVDRLVENSVLQDVAVKIDPGSRETGIAVVRETSNSGNAAEECHVAGLFQITLVHRGLRISAALKLRAGYRRNRRYRKTRYRPARFSNRTKPEGWLAPSLMHRVNTTMTWVNRLRKLAPVTRLSQELVRFDTQRMQNAEISGIEYQQGTLAGYEVREYLLEKYNRCCVYCGKSAMDIEMQIDHVQPRAHGGSDRVSNLVLACWKCNQTKGAKPIEVFLAKKPALLKRILAGLRKPLRDAAAVNTTSWCLYRSLLSTRLPVRVGSGGQTKWNRIRFHLPKTHSLDAMCVGKVASIEDTLGVPLTVKCAGRGLHRSALTDKYGFPKTHRARSRCAFGFRTNDIVFRVYASRNNEVVYYHISVKHSGRFLLKPIKRNRYDKTTCSYRVLTRVARKDGYVYIQ